MKVKVVKMRNRAKCKLCGDIIESFHRHDFVTCSCGEISIDGGGDFYKCSARSFENFLRVDDEGNEIIPKIVEKDPDILEVEPIETKNLSRKEKVSMLKYMADSIEKLPSNAMTLPITHYDHLSLIILLESILREE